jgi:hypothetical protein
MAQEELVPTPGTRVGAMDEKQRSVAGSTFGQPAQHLKIAKTGAIHADAPRTGGGVQQGGQVMSCSELLLLWSHNLQHTIQLGKQKTCPTTRIRV